MNNTNQIKTTENTIKKIYSELSINQLKHFLNNTNIFVIIKFGANWCHPCQKIKDYCHNCFMQMSENIICFDIDIDISINFIR